MNDIVSIYSRTLDYLLEPIREYLEDASVSEILINGYDEIFIERAGRLQRVDAAFADENALEAALRNISQFVGKRLDPRSPSIEARLPDGSRVHIVQAPAARKGACVAIRKFSKNKLGLGDLVERGTMTATAAEFLAISVAMAKNIMVSGGTGSGKTTLLNCLSSMIGEGERIVVLEDSSELQLQQDHVVPFEARPADRHGRGGIDIRGLFKASLRMRPDRIVVGECRGGEALDMIQAMTSGHDGSMSTCHANTPKDALNRIETMAMMSGVEMPLFALRAQVGSAIDLLVQIARMRDGSRRITHITEVLGITEHNEYRVQEIFAMRYHTQGEELVGALGWSGTPPSYAEDVWAMGESDRIDLTAEIWISQVPT